MSRQTRQKIVILAKLYEAGGDPKGEWFVSFSYKNPENGRMKRFRVYEGLGKISDPEEKKRYGLALVQKINRKLKNGWNPFDASSEVIYQDQLQYQQITRQYGNQRKSNKTIRFYCNSFLEDTKVRLAPSTYTTYKSKLRIFADFLDKDGHDGNDIHAFEVKNARAFVLNLFEQRKCSKKMVNAYLNVLTNLWKSSGVHENPWLEIKHFKEENNHFRTFTDTQIKNLSETIVKNDRQLWNSIRFMFNCFIRPGELRHLKLENIDFEHSKVWIPAEISKNRKEGSVDIPLYFIRELMEEKYHEYPKYFYIIGNKGVPSDKPVSRNYLYKRFQKFRTIAELSPGQVFYSFKHTGVKKLAETGVDWLQLKNQLRHASLDQVLEYAHELLGASSDFIRNNAPKI